ncbi:MAG: hypothetical protein JRH10_08605 [Deltaproteobacteria bacterium]|nr:hypothetical protein [Deltaproteobacteria bacterium]MBW2446701.1 hypothetical protein [Deltaproteobacteria bacterium]
MKKRTKIDLLTVAADGDAEAIDDRIDGGETEEATFPECFAASGTNVSTSIATLRVDPSDRDGA